jgi:hypothetical protein
MSAKFSDIVAYFKQLASEHIAIQHSESEKHFYRFELEEVLSTLGKVNYPALILEGYRYRLIDNKSDNVMKERSGAFIILGQLKDIGDYDAMHELWDSQEVICDDIIARIKADKRIVAAVRDFDLNSVEVALIANDTDRNYGIRCTFAISSARPMDVDPDKWNTI